MKKNSPLFWTVQRQSIAILERAESNSSIFGQCKVKIIISWTVRNQTHHYSGQSTIKLITILYSAESNSSFPEQRRIKLIAILDSAEPN